MLKFLKNNWVLVLALFLLLIMWLPLIYFGNLLKVMGRQNEEDFSVNNSRNAVIGVCLNNLAETRWMKEWAIMQEEAKKQRLIIRLKVAHHSVTRQAQQIANLIAHHVKVLIINPVSRTGLKDVLEQAHSQGIKIILYDELTAGPGDLFLGVDYRKMGRIQAEALLDKAGSGNYLIFKGPPGSYRGDTLYKAQREIFTIKGNANVNIVAVNHLTNWSADEAVNKTRAVIAHQKLQAILAPTDLIAEALVNFFKEQRMNPPYITGAGSEVTACQRIMRQEQLLTIYWDSSMLAKTSIISAKKMIQNKNITALVHIMIANRRVPEYLFPVYLVTTDKLQDLFLGKLKP
jgi:ABC-type xylose transport system substrate-binding protein